MKQLEVEKIYSSRESFSTPEKLYLVIKITKEAEDHIKKYLTIDIYDIKEGLLDQFNEKIIQYLEEL